MEFTWIRIRIGEEARKLIRELYGTNHFRYVSAQSNLGITYSLAGRNAEALRLLEEAVPSAAKLLGSDHPSLVLPLLYLGWTRLGSGQKEEALKIHREGERIARKAYGTEHPESQRIFLGLNDTLSAVGRYDERLQLWSGLFAVRQQSKGLKDPSTVSAMLECSSAYVALGKLEEAAAVLAPLDQIERWTEPIHFTVMYRQVLEACLGERISYEAHRRKLVDQFASATAPFVVEWVAKGSLLLPLEGPERQTVLGMAERAFQYTNIAPQYFAFTGALAKYRAGEWATAVQRAERSLELAKDWGVLRVLDRFVIAMTYFRMSRVDEARAVFAKASEIMQRDYPSATQVRDRNSHDILIAHVLYREAKELIEPRTP